MAFSKKKTVQTEKPKALTLYTLKLDEQQMEKLEQICDHRTFGYYAVDHSLFAFKSEFAKVNIVAYKSGKVVIQGKGTEEFVRDTIEAEITGKPELGYEEFHHPEWYEPHAGIDEAGKGDVFGPLVSCCVIADGNMVRAWREAGVKDSKALTDASIYRLEKIILNTKGVVVKKTWSSMERYNELMAKPGANLNKFLAWLHSKSIQEALKQRQVEWGMLDQFSKTPLTQNLLRKEGLKGFELKMMTKAEADPVVAAASICARAEFVRQMQKLSEVYGETLPKGASSQVKKVAGELVAKLGAAALGNFAKMHFRTCYQVLGLPVPEKPQWKRTSE